MMDSYTCHCKDTEKRKGHPTYEYDIEVSKTNDQEMILFTDFY